MKLTEFLLARIAEDEVLARAAIDNAAPDEWESELGGMNLWPEDIAFWEHITPARIIAECTAKRAIVELWEEEGVDAGYMVAIDQVVRTLAAIYREHADYRSEWAV